MLKTLGAVYIYIYIVRFNRKNKVNIEEKIEEAMYFSRPKIYGFLYLKE